jgi:hypothetical protein
MPVSVDGKISITIRDLAIFSNVGDFQKFITETAQAKLVESASSMYTTTTPGSGLFKIQPLRTRCIADVDADLRGVEISVSVSGRVG